MFVRLTQSMLIITDRDRTGGIICGDKEAKSGTVISQGYLELLMEMLLKKDSAVTFDDFAAHVRKRGFKTENTRGDKDSDVARLIHETHGINISRTKTRFGKKKEDKAPKEGFIELNGMDLWHPAGELLSRKIGRYTVVLVTSDDSISGRLKPIREIELAGVFERGIGLSVSAANCGACGLCGLCGLCGEVNAASAVAAVTAVSALSAVSFNSGMHHDLTVDELHKKGRQEFGELLDATATLGKLARH